MWRKVACAIQWRSFKRREHRIDRGQMAVARQWPRGWEDSASFVAPCKLCWLAVSQNANLFMRIDDELALPSHPDQSLSYHSQRRRDHRAAAGVDREAADRVVVRPGDADAGWTQHLSGVLHRRPRG